MDILSPASPATGELGAFLEGIIFSPDGVSASIISEPPLESTQNLVVSRPAAVPAGGRFGGKSTAALVALAMKRPAEVGRTDAVKRPPVEKRLPPELLVKPENVTPKDVLCIRGTGANGQAANALFRALITANSGHYQALTNNEERETYAAEFWSALKEKGHRFLKPRARDYELLTDEACAKKISQALKDCRTNNGASAVNVAAYCDSFDYSNTKKTKPPPKKKQKKEAKVEVEVAPEPAEPVKEKSFDETAKASINSMLNRESFSHAMVKAWGDDTQRKKSYEDKLLKRFRLAAQMGLSCKEYSERLLPLLLREIEENGS